MSFLILLFGMMANAADKAHIKISSFTHDELAQNLVFERVAEKDKLIGRKKQYFRIGKTGALCDVSFLMNKAAIGCEFIRPRHFRRKFREDLPRLKLFFGQQSSL